MNQGVTESQAPSDLRSLRHDLLGRMNAIVMCAATLDDETLPLHEALEFLAHIEKTTDKLVVLLEKLEAMSE